MAPAPTRHFSDGPRYLGDTDPGTWLTRGARLIVSGVKLVELPAEAVVRHHANPIAMSQRYNLDLSKLN